MSGNETTAPGGAFDDRRADPTPTAVAYVEVNGLRAENDTTTCLRPLGLCELGGCCDSCWYRPDHPRFEE